MDDTIEPPREMPQPEDLHTVLKAAEALRAFGGDLNRTQANMLLMHWRHVAELDETGVAAVLRRFPEDPSEFMRPRSWQERSR